MDGPNGRKERDGAQSHQSEKGDCVFHVESHEHDSAPREEHGCRYAVSGHLWHRVMDREPIRQPRQDDEGGEEERDRAQDVEQSIALMLEPLNASVHEDDQREADQQDFNERQKFSFHGMSSRGLPEISMRDHIRKRKMSQGSLSSFPSCIRF